MTMKKYIFPLISLAFLLGCEPDENSGFSSDGGITGKSEYLTSPYLTPGDKAYMVGHQDGSFPDLGWHVAGEMGGIWAHPIKLMDGFTANFEIDGASECLDNASRFTNYPFFNKHHFELASLGLEIERFNFVPEGKKAVYVEFQIKNTTNENLSAKFTFDGKIDLRPVWLGEQTGMIDGPDEVTFNESKGTVEAKDRDNDWFVVYGGNKKPNGQTLGAASCDYERKGQGTNAGLSYHVEIGSGETETLSFVISGSAESKKEALDTYDLVSKNIQQLIEAKAKRYDDIKSTAFLQTPNDQINEAFLWTKYNTDWLINDVEGLGRGITAGNPDYPWFFGADSEYALQGAIAVGMKDIVYSTIAMIDSVSNAVNNGSGKIMHEMSTNGTVFNPGNLNETPQYATLIWEVFKWTGDMDFLRKYYPTVEAGLNWLLEENDEDGNLLADGYGMMEIHGLESEMIDVAAYTYKAFMDAAEMASILGDPTQAKDYRMKANQLAEIINSDFWVEEFDSYADFIGTAQQAEHLIEGAIIRADTLDKPWAVEELKATQRKVKSFDPNKKQGFVLYHNWVVNTPMEVGVADPKKAIKALETGSQYVNPFGVFVTGIDRDESAGTDVGGFAEKMEIFSYTGAVMTLPTGVQAIAENNYGRPDKALEYLEKMTNSFSYALPGSMYEVSPDFGMHTQAWNIYAYAVPIIKQFFGLEPMAHLNQVTLNPVFPKTWNEAEVRGLKIGLNLISVKIERKKGMIELSIEQKDPNFKVRIPNLVELKKGEKLNGFVVGSEIVALISTNKK